MALIDKYGGRSVRVGLIARYIGNKPKKRGCAMDNLVRLWDKFLTWLWWSEVKKLRIANNNKRG